MVMHTRPTETRICLWCKKPFEARKDQLKVGKGKYCSISCKSKYGRSLQNQSGKYNPAWKHGNSRSPECLTAWRTVYRAIKSGHLSRRPCSNCCSLKNIHAHHEDYTKPLDVIWFCRKCHDQHHNKSAAT